MQIQINGFFRSRLNPDQWLLQKPSDLDLHCLQRQGISGFSRTRVNPSTPQIIHFISELLKPNFFIADSDENFMRNAQKEHSAICWQCRPRSACALSAYRINAYCNTCRQRMLRSDCMDAHPDWIYVVHKLYTGLFSALSIICKSV